MHSRQNNDVLFYGIFVDVAKRSLLRYIRLIPDNDMHIVCNLLFCIIYHRWWENIHEHLLFWLTNSKLNFQHILKFQWPLGIYVI